MQIDLLQTNFAFEVLSATIPLGLLISVIFYLVTYFSGVRCTLYGFCIAFLMALAYKFLTVPVTKFTITDESRPRVIEQSVGPLKELKPDFSQEDADRLDETRDKFNENLQ